MAARRGVRIYSAKADDMAAHREHVARVLRSDPDLLLDNGADLIAGSAMATASRRVNTHVEEFDLPNGRRVHLRARGEMLNLTAATGHQIEIMDLGFALQAHAMRILSQDPDAFSPGYQPVPESVNRAIAEHGLRTLSSVDLD
jgi:adenosylhomocysteinase